MVSGSTGFWVLRFFYESVKYGFKVFSKYDRNENSKVSKGLNLQNDNVLCTRSKTKVLVFLKYNFSNKLIRFFENILDRCEMFVLYFGKLDSNTTFGFLYSLKIILTNLLDKNTDRQKVIFRSSKIHLPTNFKQLFPQQTNFLL